MAKVGKIKKAYPFTKAAIERFVEKYPAPLKVLDVGARDGYSLHLFRKYGYDCQGVDIDKDYVGFCKSRKYSVEYDDFQNTKVTDKFDAVYSSHAIEHCDDPLGFVESGVRVLEKGGVFYAYFPLEHYRKKHKNSQRDDSMKHRQFWPTLGDFRRDIIDKCSLTEVEFYITRKWRDHTEALFVGKNE